MESNKTKITDLKPAAYNPRKISPEQLKRLKKSLQEFGDLGGIVCNRRTSRLIGGHQRIKAIPKNAEIEKQELPTPDKVGTVALGYIIIDGVRFSYREVDWEESREKAANVAANAHGGEWDFEALEKVLKDVAAANINLELTGFSLSDIYQTFGNNILGESPEQLLNLSEKLRETTKILEAVKEKTDKKNHTDYYLVIVFRSYEERMEFTAKHNLPDNRYVDGNTLDRLISEKTLDIIS